MRAGDSRKAGSSLLLLCLPLPVRQAQAPAPSPLALGRQLLICRLQPLAHQLLTCLLAGDSCMHSQQDAAAPISYVLYRLLPASSDVFCNIPDKGVCAVLSDLL